MQTISQKSIAIAVGAIIGLAPTMCLSREARFVTSSEMKIKDQWVEKYVKDTKPQFPFSFRVGSQNSATWLASCKKAVVDKKLDEKRKEKIVTWTDTSTGLQVRWVVVEYTDFPTVEWTLYFKNTGPRESEVISQINALDMTLDRGDQGEFILHRTIGDGVNGIYNPAPITMEPSSSKSISPFGGRPSSHEFPYFNVETPKEGVVFAIGWPGQWTAKFERDGGTQMRITAGQEVASFKVLPEEELRTPLIVAQFWKDDRQHCQNVWRRWMLAHNTPRVNGKVPKPAFSMCNMFSYGFFGFDEACQREWMQRYLEEKIEPEYLWIDVSWFNMNSETLVHDGVHNPDPKRFPNGLRSLSDDYGKKGIKTIVWVEPEHIYPGPTNWVVANHPEWLLKVKPGHETEMNQDMPLKDRMIYNLGNPEARNWLINNTDKVIKREGIGVYRHDFNIEPLRFWRENDEADRQGVTENKYVTGFLTYYDELLKRSPGMWIDNCSSGGRRNDVETLRRSIPLLRSDTWGDPTDQQCQTYGLANWIPFWGVWFNYSENKDLTYIFRSHMGPSFCSLWDLRVKMNYDQHRKIIAEWKEVRDLVLNGDYYPLTPFSRELGVWMAWQYNRPREEDGLIQAFRRPQSKEASMILKLADLDRRAKYAVKNYDTNSVEFFTGASLMDQGIKVTIDDTPGSALITYKKQK